MTNLKNLVFEFGNVRVEPGTFKVFQAGAPVAFEPKTLLLLIFLIENRERLVEKREILDVVWKDVAVTENALTREVAKLRRLLGDDPKAPRYIQTVHTRGYRFIAPVLVVDSEEGRPAESQAQASAETAARKRAWAAPVAMMALGTLCVVLAAALFLRRNPAQAKPGAAGHPASTLVILPFQPLGEGAADPYLGLGMADALITKLGNSDQLAVRPLSTVIRYVNATQDSIAIGRSLSVDYVLEGKYQKLGDRLRVTVQLLCIACNGASRWAASYDDTSSDLFRLQDSISQRMVNALTLELNEAEDKRLRMRQTSNQEAYYAFVKGKYFSMYDSKDDARKAVEFSEEAVRLDPKFAAAWAQLADGYHRLEWYGAAPAEFIEKSRAAARKAVELDDTLASAHATLGLIAFQYDWDFAEADREYRRTLELMPRFLHQWTARYLLVTNQKAAAEDVYRRFLEEAPFSLAGSANAAQFFFLTAQYERARVQVQKTLELDGNYAPAHELLGLIEEQQGKNDLAAVEFRRAVELSGGATGAGSLGHLYGRMGRKADAEALLAKLVAQARQRYVAPFDTALIHAGLGDASKAMGDLERGYEDRSLSSQSLRFDPRLKEVRATPRFHEFARRVGLLPFVSAE